VVGGQLACHLEADPARAAGDDAGAICEAEVHRRRFFHTPNGPALLPDPAIGTGNIQTKTYQVTNPSSGSQSLNQVVVSIANGNGSARSAQANAGKPACTEASFSVGGQPVGQSWTDTSLSGDYKAGASQSGTATVQMIDNGANQDNCQGVTVPLYFQAS